MKMACRCPHHVPKHLKTSGLSGAAVNEPLRRAEFNLRHLLKAWSSSFRELEAKTAAANQVRTGEFGPACLEL